MRKEVLMFDKFRKFSKSKKGIVMDYLPWLILGLLVLAVVMASIFLFKEKGVSFIDKIKDLIRGR